jgi:hypothetical protein
LSIVMKTTWIARALAVLVATGVLTASCGGNDTPTAPTTPVGPQTEVFSGTLDVQGSNVFSFTVTTTGQVSITLASLLSTRPGPAINNAVALGVGTPLGTDCSITNSVTATPGLTAQLVNSLTPATYCARVSDIGNLGGPVNFTVRIVHP